MQIIILIYNKNQMKSNKHNYKFSITQLSLTNKSYPFDFFIKITAEANQDFWQSPIIDARTFSYSQELPWNFRVSSRKLILEFVQIQTANQTQIKRAYGRISSKTQSEEDVELVNERTNNVICVVSYTLMDLSEEKGKIKKNKEMETNFAYENKDEEKVAFEQVSQTQLTEKLEKLTKTIDKMLKTDQEERKKFSNYLNESSNLLKKLLSEDENKNQPQSSIEEIKEESAEQKLTTHENWYKNKYGKKRSQTKQPLLKNVLNEEKQILLEYSNFSPSELEASIIFSNLQIQTQHKPNQIDLVRKGEKKELLLSLKNEKGAFKWGKSFVLPNEELKVKVKGEEKLDLDGNLGNKQLQNSAVVLYDKDGGEKGLIKFQHKKIGICQIQTTDLLLPQAEENEMEQEKKEELNEFLPEQQNQNTEQQVVEAGQQKLIGKNEHEVIEKNENEVIRKNEHEVVEKNEHGVVEEKEKQLVLVEGIEQNEKNRPEIIEPKVQGTQEKEEKVAMQLQRQSDHKKYEENFLKFPERKGKSRYENQDADVSNLEEQNLANVVKGRKRQKKQRRTHRELIIKKEDVAIDTKGLRKKSFELKSKQISEYFKPIFSREESMPEEVTPPRRINTQGFSESNEKSLLNFEARTNHPIRSISFKINSISVRLSNKDCEGKYVKLEIVPHQPYITQTLISNQDLNWKGHGYFFENVSYIDELVISLYNDSALKNYLIGTARISVSLLNLDEENEVAFSHEYLLNYDHEKVGQIIIGSQKIRKRRRSLSIKNGREKIVQLEPLNFNGHSVSLKKKNYSSEKRRRQPKTNTNRTKETRKMMNFVEDSKVSMKPSSIRSRKYRGGNVIIGKAPRFRIKEFKEVQPGPGQYEIPSGFERHASPL